MALDAEVANGGKRNHLIEFRPVGAMTAQTIHRQIGIAHVLVLVADGMRGMLHPFMAGTAQLYGRGLFLQERIGRGMGVVTRRALTIVDGLMLGAGALLAFDGVAVATTADLHHRSLDQLGRPRGMGVMAVQAAVGAGHRPVDTLRGKDFVDHVVVAAPAELKSRAFDSQRRGRGGLLMALVAHFFSHRGMDLIVKDALAVGTVRIVTGDTGGLGHRVSHVHGTELLVRGVVALAAKVRRVGTQKKGTALGAVRVVTGKTASHGFVGKFLPLEGVGHILMTVEAEFIPATNQVVLVLGGMGVVAEGAAAVRHHFMRAAGIFDNHVAVAEGTNLALGRGQQFSMIGGMGVVATGTFPALYRRMDKFLGDLVGKIHMTAKTELAGGSGFEFEIPFLGIGCGIDSQR